MARSYQQQLDDCDAAIAKIERLGQAHGSDGGRSLDRATYDQLVAERARLTRLAAREARGGGISVTGITPVDG